MKKHLFRLLTLLCVFAFIVTAVPVTVSAEELTAAYTNIDSNISTEADSGKTFEEAAIIGEITEMREENVKYFRRDDGMIVAAMYDKAVHYQDGDEWKEIDNTLVAEETRDGVTYYKNTANKLQVRMPDQLNTNTPIAVQNGEYTLQWTLQSGQSKSTQITPVHTSQKKTTTLTTTSSNTVVVKNQKELNEQKMTVEKLGSSVVYDRVYDNVLFHYDVVGDKFKESIILAKPTNQTEFSFLIQAQGLTAQLQEDGSVRFFAPKTEEPVFVIASPYMFDSNHEHSQDVTVQLTSVKGGYRYVLTPSQTWLQAEERQYPVIIDPTIKLGDEDSEFETTEIYSGAPNTNYSARDLAYVGTYFSGSASAYYECQTLLKIPFSNNMLAANEHLVSATLILRINAQSNPQADCTQVRAYPVTSSWDESTVTWNTCPTFDSTMIDYATIDFEPVDGQKPSLNGDPDSDPNSDVSTFDITSIVSSWIENPNGNYGLLFKTKKKESYTDQVIWYTEESNIGNAAPTMQINYREVSGLEDYWTYTTTSVGRGVSASVNNLNGVLTVVAPIAGVDGNLMPVSISHVYNSTNAFSTFHDGKWKTNYHIEIEETDDATNSPAYTFIDGDGTPHFMCVVEDPTTEAQQGTTLIKDIDGLGFTLTIDEASTDARYVVTDLNDNEIEFNQHGNLVCLRNTNNHTITIAYNNNTSLQKISRITDGAGRHYTFAYNSGHLASIADPAERVTTFTYTNSHELSRITYPDGEYTDFSYENRELRRITGDGQRIVIEYDSVLPTQVASMTLTNPSETTDINRFEFIYHHNATTIKDVSCDEAESDILATYQFNEYGHTVCVLNENNGTAQSFKFGKPGNANTGEENQLLTSSDPKQSIFNLVQKGRLDSDCFSTGATFTVTKSSGVTGTVTYDSSKGHTANGSILVDCTSYSLSPQQYIYAEQRYNISEAGYYTLSAFVNTDDTLFLDGYGAVIRLERWSRQGALLTSAQSTVDYTPETEWFRAGTSIYCESTDTLKILLGTSGEGMDGKIWFDDVQLEKDTESINEFNLLEFSDIGTKINHWEKTNTIWVHPTNSVTIGGISFRPVEAYGEITSEAYMKQTVPIQNGQAGDSYSLGAWAKGVTAPLDGHEDRIYGVRLDFTNQDGTTTTRRLSFNPAYTEWQFLSGEAVADKPYDSVTFYIEYSHNVNQAYFALPFLYKDNFGHSYTYDKDGNVVSATDQENSQTAYTYNDQQLSSLAAPTGTKQFVSSNDDTHNAESVLTTNGQRYEYQYDSNGNLTNTTVGVEDFVTTLESGHIYYIRNAYSGNALDSAGLTAGDVFHNWRWIKNNSMQKFTLVSTGEADVYALQSSDAPHLRMKVNVANEEGDCNFILSEDGEESSEIPIHQQFRITSNDNGTFTIFTKTSGYESCVDGQPGDATDASNATPIGQQTYVAGDAGQQWYFIEYGVISEEETPEDTLTDDLYMTSSATYTSDGNYLASTTDAFGETTTYDINELTGNTESVTAPNNVMTYYSYDDSGIHNTRVGVKTTTNAFLGSVEYTYDGDRLTGIETYTGQQYSFVYDEFGRTTSVWVGEAGTGRRLARYEYTPGQGLLSSLIYENNSSANYAYDDLGRQIKMWYRDNTATGYETVYNSRGLVGLLKDLTADTNTRYWYDLAGRLTHIRQESTSLGYRISEAYYHFEDGTNRLLQDRIYVQTGQDLGDLYGSVTDYTYGDIAAGEMPDSIYSIAQNGVTEVEYTYDELGRIVQRKLPVPNVYQNYYYTNPYTDTNHTTNQVKMIASYDEDYVYNYDSVGNITQVYKDAVLSESYSYDYLGQLLSANIDGTEYEYSYDKNGNILTSLEGHHYNTYEYAPYSNMPWKDQLVTYNNQTITYDAIGNPLTYRDGLSFTWQNGRQLASTTKNGVTTSYTYNGDGTRRSKTVDNTTTQYYYVNGRLQALTVDIYTAFFLYDDTGRPYAVRLTILPVGATSPYLVMAYYKYNLQGDVIGLYSDTGVEFVTYTYDPWGKVLSAEGVMATLITVNPFRYRGYVYDDETGLYYCNSRYYDPETGRWINADGFVSTGQGVLGYNMYAYCNNNPILLIDYYGYRPMISTNTSTETKTERNFSMLYMYCMYNMPEGGKTVYEGTPRICTDGSDGEKVPDKTHRYDTAYSQWTSKTAKFLDAYVVHYVVMPESSEEAELGDLAILINKNTGQFVRCIIGETGDDENGWGEVSIAAIWDTGYPNHMTADNASGIDSAYQIIIFPGTRHGFDWSWGYNEYPLKNGKPVVK